MFAITSNSDADNISIIDIPGPSFETVDVGDYPRGIAITPNGDFAYVANAHSIDVSVIDLATNNVLTTINLNVADEPQFLAITPDGAFVYVVHRYTSYVSVIDADPANTLTYHTVVAEIDLGTADAQNIDISPDGRFAYVAHGRFLEISVIDLNPAHVDDYNTVIKHISTVVQGATGGPNGITFAPIQPDGSFFAYVVIGQQRNPFEKRHLFRINTGSHSIEGDPIPIRAGPRVAFLPDASYAYVTNGEYHSVTVIDVQTGVAVGTIATPDWPFDIQIVQR